MEQTRGLFCTCDSGVARCQSQHQDHFLANAFGVRSILHGQVSLAAVNQIRVVYEVMNRCKNLKIYKRIASKNVNICSLRYDLPCETIYKYFNGMTYLVKHFTSL